MEPHSSAKTATVRIASVAIQRLAEISCRTCGGPLDICQPDPNLPGRFIASCPDCLGWFLMVTMTDQAMVLMTSLEPLLGLTGSQDVSSTTP